MAKMNTKEVDNKIDEVIKLMDKNLDFIAKKGKFVEARRGAKAIIDIALGHIEFCGVLNGIPLGLQGKYLADYMSAEHVEKLIRLSSPKVDNWQRTLPNQKTQPNNDNHL